MSNGLTEPQRIFVIVAKKKRLRQTDELASPERAISHASTSNLALTSYAISYEEMGRKAFETLHKATVERAESVAEIQAHGKVVASPESPLYSFNAHCMDRRILSNARFTFRHS